MAFYSDDLPYPFCGKPVGPMRKVLAFTASGNNYDRDPLTDLIDDGVVHRECLARHPQRGAIVAAWNTTAERCRTRGTSWRSPAAGGSDTSRGGGDAAGAGLAGAEPAGIIDRPNRPIVPGLGDDRPASPCSRVARRDTGQGQGIGQVLGRIRLPRYPDPAPLLHCPKDVLQELLIKHKFLDNRRPVDLPQLEA